MKQNLFDIIAEQTDGITKEAFLGPALRLGTAALKGLKGVGGMVIRNPMKTIGGAFTASDLASGSQRFANMANRNPTNPFTRTM